MRTIFIADAHLTAQDDLNYRLLLRFLRELEGNTETLFIMGDLFDFWLGFPSNPFRQYDAVLEALLALTRTGCRLVYFEGNHDFHLGSIFRDRLGAEIHSGPAILTVQGRQLLLCHGDQPTLSCKGCHGARVTPTAGVAFNSVAGEPNYNNGGIGATNANSHQKHVGAAGAAACDTCHTNTTTNGTAIKAGSTIHIDKSINVDFNTTKAGAGVTWTQGSKTCSTACHGKTSPRWGETSTGCNFCHPYDVGSWNVTAQRWPSQLSATSEGFGAHEKHIAHLKTVLGLSLAPLTDTFGSGTSKQICGACHTITPGNHIDVAAGNARSINFADSTYTYGLAGFDLKFGGNATYGGTSVSSSSVNPKNCLNTSCHIGTAPVWAPY